MARERRRAGEAASPSLAPRGACPCLVAYKRAGCGACAFFEAAVKPRLLATFDDAITLEERDLANVEAAAPLVVIVGKRTSLLIGLPDDNASARFIEAVREAIESEPLPDAPMSVHFTG